MEFDHSSSPLIETVFVLLHPHDKRQKCWTRDAELSQVKTSGPTCHTSKLIKRCHVAIIWLYKLPSLESSSCARLLHQSFANDSAKTYLHRIYVHVAAESAQKLIPGVSFGNLWQHTASMFKLSYGPTSLSAVSTLSTIGVDGGCVHIRHELHDFV